MIPYGKREREIWRCDLDHNREAGWVPTKGTEHLMEMPMSVVMVEVIEATRKEKIREENAMLDLGLRRRCVVDDPGERVVLGRQYDLDAIEGLEVEAGFCFIATEAGYLMVDMRGIALTGDYAQPVGQWCHLPAFRPKRLGALRGKSVSARAFLRGARASFTAAAIDGSFGSANAVHHIREGLLAEVVYAVGRLPVRAKINVLDSLAANKAVPGFGPKDTKHGLVEALLKDALTELVCDMAVSQMAELEAALPEVPFDE